MHVAHILHVIAFRLTSQIPCIHDWKCQPMVLVLKSRTQNFPFDHAVFSLFLPTIATGIIRPLLIDIVRSRAAKRNILLRIMFAVSLLFGLGLPPFCRILPSANLAINFDPMTFRHCCVLAQLFLTENPVRRVSR